MQSDPFARPSRARLRVPAEIARLPDELSSTAVRRLAVEDFLAREVRASIRPDPTEGSGKSGRVDIDAGGQSVLERAAVVVTDAWVEARIEVGLPARGRRILGSAAHRLLVEELPRLARAALVWSPEKDARGRDFVTLVERQDHLRGLLASRQLVAFVSNGSILPRESGASDQPMREAVPFASPASLEVELELPDGTRVAGMGVPEGVTLIVGGGYHGKSTLLRALERGVYPHVPADGREGEVTRADAVKIRAEDGRSVSGVDLRPFIDGLPNGTSSARFWTTDASGSTSQAASLLEALEVGAKVLLLDEDSSATNFMMRDARMQALVAAEHEPIVPFVDRVRELFDTFGVSTILVMGGSGDYFEPADNIIKMVDFTPLDVSAEAKTIAGRMPTGRARTSSAPFTSLGSRYPVAFGSDGYDLRVRVSDRRQVRFGSEIVDLSAVEQLVDRSQTRAAAHAVRTLVDTLSKDAERTSVNDMMNAVDALLDRDGVDALALPVRTGEHPGNLARPRRFEIASLLNRLRSIEMEPRS